MKSYNIHAGHCPYGHGACGAVGILNESIENRIVKNKVVTDLKALGNTVYDCTDDSNCSMKQNLYNIAVKCNTHKADVDISIHLNAGGGTGVEVWVTGNHQTMIDLGDRICQTIASELDIPNRGVKTTSDLYILNHTDAPALLIECCFVDHQMDADHWDAVKCANAISEAITGKKIVQSNQDQAVQISGDSVNDEGLWYRVHVADLGTLEPVHDGQTAGTTGYGKAIQALWIDPRKLAAKYQNVKANVKVHMEGTGWKLYREIQHDTMIGTVAENRQIEAVEIEIQGLPSDMKLMYRTHLTDAGWTGWVPGGFGSGSVGLAKAIEAIQLKIT